MIPCDTEDIAKEYTILLHELEMYNPELLDKPRLLAITKCDLIDEEMMQLLKPGLPGGVPYLFISAVAQQGITALKDKLWEMITAPGPEA
jgi:GTP-binding protein